MYHLLGNFEIFQGDLWKLMITFLRM